MSLLKDSHHVRLLETGAVVVLNLPDGSKVGLSPTQAAHAKIVNAGNFGRSKVTVTLQLELETLGDAETTKTYIASELAKALDEARDEVERLRKKANDLAAELNATKSPAVAS